MRAPTSAPSEEADGANSVLSEAANKATDSPSPARASMHHPPAFDSWTRPLTNLNPNLPNATPVNYVVHRRLTSDSDLPATYNILRLSRVLATLPPKGKVVLARLSSHLGSPVLCFVHLSRLDAASTTSSSSDSIASGSGTYGHALHWATLLAICSPP